MAGVATMISAAMHRPRPLSLGQQGLGHDALQHERQLGPHLGLLVGGEDVDDTIDGLGGGVGV